jgi:hypothetical protein
MITLFRRALSRRMTVMVGGAAFATLFAIACCAASCAAQEAAFTPRYDGIDEGRRRKSATPTAVVVTKAQPVYSFARFNGLFKSICAGLEAERRRARVFEVAKIGLAEEGDCSSCRALYRQLLQSCGPPVSPRSRTKPLNQGSLQDDGRGAGEAVSELREPTPTPTTPARYPRTELLDAVSRLSAELYELEPGAGSTFKAVKNFEERLLKVKDLAPGERDYFGVLTTYLLASWDGRPDSPHGPRKLSREDIADLFQ